jgi:cyanate lyase
LLGPDSLYCIAVGSVQLCCIVVVSHADTGMALEDMQPDLRTCVTQALVAYAAAHEDEQDAVGHALRVLDSHTFTDVEQRSIRAAVPLPKMLLGYLKAYSREPRPGR